MENDNALKEAQDRLTTAKKLNSEAADENNQIVVAGMRLNAENVEQFGQYGEAVTTTTSEIETLKTTQEQLQEKLKSADEDLEKYTNDVVTLGEESAAYSEQATLFLGGVEITEEALEKLGLSADEATEKYENLANMTQNAFEKIQQDSAITVEKMEQNLSSNIDTVNNWSQNIGKLANTNLDTGFLQVLRDLGPKAAGTVANMVKHIEKGGSFDNLNALYKEGGIAAVEALVSSLGVSDVEVAGEQMNIDIAKGIESSDATSETITKVVTLTKETAQNAVKEADFVSVGKNIPAGIASGIEKGSYIAVSAAISLAKKTLSATKPPLKSKSPSKAFEKIGKTAPQGVAMGIKNESYVAEKESEKLAKKTLDAFRVSKIEENISSNVLQTSSINEIKTPTFNITLTGQVDMDGFNVGKIVMKNIDDVAAFTMRGN